MNDVGKKEAAKDLGSKLIATVEKQAKDPTWLTNLKIEEAEFEPVNMLYSALAKYYRLRYASATNFGGGPNSEHVAVHVDDPVEKEKVENVQAAVLAKDLAKCFLSASIGLLHERFLAKLQISDEEKRGLQSWDYFNRAVEVRKEGRDKEADEWLKKSRELGEPYPTNLMKEKFSQMVKEVLAQHPEWRPSVDRDGFEPSTPTL